MKFDEVKGMILEMGFEVGKRKDGTVGYRSVVNGNMTDETPPENKAFADAALKVLQKKKLADKLSKFDLTTVDIESMANGAAKINFEDGTSTIIPASDMFAAMKGRV